MTDNCPRCLTTTDPQNAADDPTRYVCRACGHTWTTNRNKAVWAPPADAYATYDDPDAWEANDPHPEPWWTDQHQDQHAPNHHDLIAEILAREAHTTWTVERADDPTE